MKTEHRLAKALKEMLAKAPLDSISVTALSDACGVSRKTFYYHFHDIYDLLTLVFLDERIDGITTTKTPEDMLKKIYNYYEKNINFIDTTINSAGRDLFQEFVYNNVYQSFIRMILLNQDAKRLTPNERKSIVRFYTAGVSSAIVFYLTNTKNKSLDGLKLSMLFLGEDFLSKSVNDLIQAKENKS